MDDFAFSRVLRDWFRGAARPLPWRETKDPYKIWLSEVILQQTRVDQGLAYYLKFIEAYPDVQSLAVAPDDEVLRLWQGLGYYSRARNLKVAAGQIMEHFNGKFPADNELLRQLKGVGEYTAAAISSFAFGLPHAVVDGNVFRFLTRFAGIYTPIDSPKGKQEVAALAGELLDPAFAAEHNQAMMEMGATVCKASNPLCNECPFSMACHALLHDAIQELPVKEKKTNVSRRYLVYFFVTDGSYTWIKKRESAGIWQGLFEFPGLEYESDPGELAPLLPEVLEDLNFNSLKKYSRVRHLLTHRELLVDFWKMDLAGPAAQIKGFEKIPVSGLVHYAFPRLFTRFFEDQALL